ncbi:TPA: hypothetical protein NHQ21_004643 [Pseudomonas aeruginosa]|jgi:hypothetical protein|uniref:hypothetical protein n=1 Tax=Pseudomonadota TaxID=1224 RepID=UPI000791AAAB|nr:MULTISPECIES: hypothetical protein [Pseudomonadota]HAT5011384.1 hypothetical protein [Serratia marcescens]KAA5593084.1 hypothetical protein F3H14_03635 [Pseudomonas aeruginosa]KAA5619089.1 hypothetical protein F3H15_11275 [Pseudomonas aeruginosa]KAA5637572.1 hypothetical protein F3H16_24700 [Pseudomonas aeruginosa]KAA5663373.1 hypothetical protein F3G64_26630 [Pseudomonas aeruginosa]
MIYIDSTDDALDKRVKSVCAPLFATGQFLHGGHSETTINATVTFIQFESRIYAVTCHHVLSAFLTEALRTGRRIVPSIHSGQSIHQFHWYGPQGQYRWSFLSCRDFPSNANINDQQALSDMERRNMERPDIAIAEITSVWPVMQNSRGAEAINLDDWTEADWSSIQPVWLAYGFPDGHKYRTSDKVAAPMPRVAVELASSTPSSERPTYTLCSTLAVEHGWGLSGLSGGPVLVAHIDEDLYAYVGITFEGAPSAKELEENPESFIGKRDIVLRGYHLTPNNFRDWLLQLAFGVELS